MQKYAIIEQFCDELLYHPGIHRQETLDSLILSAGLVEFDVKQMACDDSCLEWSPSKAANYIRDQVAFCRTPTLEMIFSLLMEGSTFH